MSAIEEKRMYDERRPETVVYVATGQGVVTVKVAGDQVGRFSLDHRCTARDIATADGRVYVATDEGVFAGPGEFESLGLGGAVAVDVDDHLLAADGGGTVSRYRDSDWEAIGTVESVRALSGDLVAASNGVYRLDSDGLTHVGLNDVYDVAAAGAPLAAAADGLYRLGNGWLREHDGVSASGANSGSADNETESDVGFSVVAADDLHAHAATAETLYERDETGEWSAVELPAEEPVADVGYGECIYAATQSGTFLVDADPETTPDGAGGWRSRSLGLPDVRAIAVASPANSSG